MKPTAKQIVLILGLTTLLISPTQAGTPTPNGVNNNYPELTYRESSSGGIAHYAKGQGETTVLGQTTYAMGWGDPNNIGQVELVVRRDSAPYIRRYDRQGNDLGGVTGQYDKPKSSSPISIMDLNNDGNSQSGVMFRNQNGQLGITDQDTSVQFSPTGFKNPIGSIDFDKDGYEEILYTDGSGHLHYINYESGDGDPSDVEVSSTSITVDTAGTAVADITGNGNPDVFYPDRAAGKIKAIDYQGNTATVGSVNNGFSSGTGHIMAATDWDQDGNVDIAFSDSGNNLKIMDSSDRSITDLVATTNGDPDLYGYVIPQITNVQQDQQRYNRIQNPTITFESSDPEGYDDIVNGHAKVTFVAPDNTEYEVQASRTDSGYPSDGNKDFKATWDIPNNAPVGTYEYQATVRDEKGAGQYQTGEFNVTRVSIQEVEAYVNGTTWQDVTQLDYFESFTKMRATTCVPEGRSVTTANFSFATEYDQEYRLFKNNFTSRTDTGSSCNEPFQNNKMQIIYDNPDQEMDDSGVLNTSAKVKLGSGITDRMDDNWRVPFGNLSVKMEKPTPQTTTTVKRFNTFKMNGTVTCQNGECASKGERVEFWADPLRTGEDKVKVTVTEDGLKGGEKVVVNEKLKYSDGTYNSVDRKQSLVSEILEVIYNWL